MITFQTTPNEKNYIKRILTSEEFKNRGHFDGNPEQRQIGLEAEYGIGKLFYIPFGELRTKVGEPDRGFDLVIKGFKADVKCLINNYDPQPHYSINIPDCQLNKEKDIVIALMYNRKNDIFFAVGWYPIKELKPEWYHIKGSQKIREEGSTFIYKTDTWDIPIAELRDIEHLK